MTETASSVAGRHRAVTVVRQPWAGDDPAHADGTLLVIDGSDFLELIGGAPAIRARLMARYQPGQVSAS